MKQFYCVTMLLFILGKLIGQTQSLPFCFVEYHLIDTSRQELYPHKRMHNNREFMMQVWIPVSQKPCPLILFSHGLGDNFNGMTYIQLCQRCASQGYVVASVSHTYGCKPVRFSDGYISPYLFPAPFHYQKDRHIFDVETDYWVEDMRVALDECERQDISEKSLLHNAIDMAHVGVMGHSLGGSTAIQLARKDNRIAAVINLDGPLFGTHAMVPLEKPFMTLIGSSVTVNSPLFTGGIPFHREFVWRWYFNTQWLPQLNQYFASLNSDVYKITIDNIVHGAFSDEVLNPDEIITPWIRNAQEAQDIIYSYVGAFFDRYLKGVDAGLLQEPICPWMDVIIEKK
jgi:dienelactone hydrolase